MQKSRSIPSSNNNTWLEHQRQNVSQNNHFNNVGFLQQCPVQMLWLHFNHPILNTHIKVLASRCEPIEILKSCPDYLRRGRDKETYFQNAGMNRCQCCDCFTNFIHQALCSFCNYRNAIIFCYIFIIYDGFKFFKLHKCSSAPNKSSYIHNIITYIIARLVSGLI